MAVSITQTANPAGVSASSNVATYSAVSIGAAVPNRIVVVAVASELASTPIDSCTIDYGSGDTAMTSAAGLAGNFGAVYARLFWLLVPTGTTATIKVTFGTNSPSNTQNHIAVYRVLDAVYSSGGNDGSTDMDATDPLTTGSITIPSGGGFIAVAGGATDGTGKTWANASEDIDADAGALRFTTATRTTALTTTAVTCTGTNGEDGALSYIIFADNSSPTVSLSSPADAATGVSTTPDLTFTGTDADSEDVRYEVQVATASPVDVALDQAIDFFDSSTTGATHSVTVAANSNRIMVVTYAAFDSGTYTGIGTLTYNGDSFTRVAEANQGNDKNNIEIWVLRNPDSGTHDLVYTTAGGVSVSEVDLGVVSLYNADQSADYDAVADSTVTSNGTCAASVTNTVNGCWNISVAAPSITPISTYTGGTRFTTNSNGFYGGMYSTEQTPEGTVTHTYYNGDGSEVWSWGMVSIAPAVTPVIDAISGTDAGFSGSPDNSDPFASGQAVTYTVQSALDASTVYYWRVRGIDPSGSNAYGAWATTRSFTTTSGGGTAVKDIIGSGFIPFAR